MEDTPAAMDRETGQMYINPKRYFALTPFQREFVKFHEKGHYVLNTDSEMAADEYAFNHLAGTQFRSLKQCIECLEEILDENLIGHKVRVDHMYQLAMRWDKQHPINKATNLELQHKENPNHINNIDTIKQLYSRNANQSQKTKTKYIIIGVVILIVLIALNKR